MLIKTYSNPVNLEAIDEVVAHLRDGAVIVYPTDSLYAVGCDALNVRAVERICRLKGVKPEKANLSIVGDDISRLSDFVRIETWAYKEMKRLLPGAYTFILEAGRNLPKLYKNRKTVGVRVPDNDVARKLVAELGNPLLSMSVARDEDGNYFTNPELIEEHYGEAVDLVMDAGEGGMIPSSVIDVTGDEAIIIRK